MLKAVLKNRFTINKLKALIVTKLLKTSYFYFYLSQIFIFSQNVIKDRND